MSEHTYINVQQADFDVAEQYRLLAEGNKQDGAVVTFVGLVRDINEDQSVKSLTLEHYPGMTERSLTKIAEEAKQRWPLARVRIIHRVGTLELADQIVFVGVSSKHRKAAFAACEFIMDFLKTKAPFWKLEETQKGKKWIEAKSSDQQQADSWVS